MRKLAKLARFAILRAIILAMRAWTCDNSTVYLDELWLLRNDLVSSNKLLSLRTIFVE